MPTYEFLLKSRSLSDGVPHFWNPQPMKKTSLCLFTDEDSPVESEWGVAESIEKILALGLHLELPVGQWVGELTRRESISDVAKKLLLTNIKDETFHDRAFRFAADVYPVSEKIFNEAGVIANAWMDDSNHTIEKAGVAECGVFLVSLSILRLAGGSELCSMAEQIAVDESRHVSTNRGIIKDIGLNPMSPSKSLIELVRQTVDFIADGLSIPGDEIGEDFDFNKDFLLESSFELLETGIAQRLDSCLDFCTHRLPFELSQHQMYGRSIYEEVA